MNWRQAGDNYHLELTGPLGQGVANSVGLALASKWVALYAIGAGSANVAGVIEQNVVFDIMMKAWGWSDAPPINPSADAWGGQRLQRVMADEEAWAYAFGSRWGPERQREEQAHARADHEVVGRQP